MEFYFDPQIISNSLLRRSAGIVHNSRLVRESVENCQESMAALTEAVYGSVDAVTRNISSGLGKKERERTSRRMRESETSLDRSTRRDPRRGRRRRERNSRFASRITYEVREVPAKMIVTRIRTSTAAANPRILLGPA